MTLAELQDKTNEELLKLGDELGVVEDGIVPKRLDLVMRVLHASAGRGAKPSPAGSSPSTTPATAS